MSIAKIQSQDLVKIIAGKFKGQIGTVTKVVKKIYFGGKIRKFALVSGIQKIVDFRRKVVFEGQSYPGIQSQKDRLIDISNVMLVNDKGEISKSKIEIINLKKTRVYKKTGEVVVKQSPVKNEEVTSLPEKSEIVKEKKTVKKNTEIKDKKTKTIKSKSK